MNGGPASGGTPVGGAAPPYQGAGQQAKAFRGKGSRGVKQKLTTEKKRIGVRKKKRKS